MRVAIAAVFLFAMGQAEAADTPILKAGDAVVTGFAGTKAIEGAHASGAPADNTFINPNAASMKILPLDTSSPPQGQLLPAQASFEADAKDIGQVFGIALGAQPGSSQRDIYLAATSAFGLQIVQPGAGPGGGDLRLKTGAPDARWMPGLFGLAKGGGPGAIWKVDGATGQSKLFANIEENSGPGLGGIAFDDKTGDLYVSDLDTGLIHRFDASGQDQGTFDHGTEGRPNAGLAAVADDGKTGNIEDAAFAVDNPNTWGYTQPERLVYGLATFGRRLYYAIGDGPQIWSIALQDDGSFGGDARLEVAVPGVAKGVRVTGITFDAAGTMYLAERGQRQGSYAYGVFATPDQAEVIRFKRDPDKPGVWYPQPEEYAIGYPPTHRNANGGVALGLGYAETGSACSQFVWSTGENLLGGQKNAGKTADGLQGNDPSLVRPQNQPPAQAYFADFNAQPAVPDNAGHMGDVKIVPRPCEEQQGLGDSGDGDGDMPELQIVKQATPQLCSPDGSGGWQCSYTITVTNTGTDTYDGSLTVHDSVSAPPPGATMSFTAPWVCTANSATDYECTADPVSLDPGESIALGVTVSLPQQDGQVCAVLNEAQLFDSDTSSAVALVPDPVCPQTVPHLTINKTVNGPCTYNGSASVCTFTITVANAGPGVYDGSITVTDTLPAAGLTYSVSGPFTCSGNPVLTCTDPSELIPAGGSVSFNITVTVPNATAKALKCDLTNEAALTFPAGGMSSVTGELPSWICRQRGTPNDLSLRKTFKGCTGAAGSQICEFAITLINDGPGVFSGTAEVDDTPASGFPATGGGGGWTCTSGNPIACTQTFAGLPVGGTSGFTVSVKVPAGEAQENRCKVRNGAQIVSPVGGSGQNTNPGNDTASATGTLSGGRCAPQQGPEPDLVLKKRAMDCPTPTACRFGVSVSNVGSGDYSGTVTFKDELPPGTTYASNSGPWACSGTSSVVCNSTFPGIAAGKGLGTVITIGVPSSAAQAGKCKLENKATLVTPAGNSAFVTLTVPANICTTGETNLSLKKTKIECGRIACTFRVAVTNAGPGAFDDLIGVYDHASAGASGSVSATSVPMTCGSGNSFNCTTANPVALAAGESISFDVVETVAFGAAKTCTVSNTASILTPVGSPENASAADDTDTAYGTVTDPELCPRTTDRILDLRTCDPGLHDEGGQCVCPYGGLPIGGSCQPLRQPPATGCFEDSRRPDGTCCPFGAVWLDGRCDVPPVRVCAPPLVGDWPNCRCPRGSRSDPVTGRCETGLPPCQPPFIGTPGNCHCAIGSRPDREGRCIPDRDTCKPPLVGEPGRCRCPLGMRPDRDNVCARNETGCRPPLVAEDGKCLCPGGKVPLNGVCVQGPRPCAPPLMGSPGSCRCPDGKKFVNGTCVADRKPCDGSDCSNGTHTCKAGTKWNGRQCVGETAGCPSGKCGPSRQEECPRGETGTPPNCRRPTTGPKADNPKPAGRREIKCPPHTELSGGRCTAMKRKTEGGAKPGSRG